MFTLNTQSSSKIALLEKQLEGREKGLFVADFAEKKPQLDRSLEMFARVRFHPSRASGETK